MATKKTKLSAKMKARIARGLPAVEPQGKGRRLEFSSPLSAPMLDASYAALMPFLWLRR